MRILRRRGYRTGGERFLPQLGITLGTSRTDVRPTVPRRRSTPGGGRPRRKSGRRCRIGAVVFVAGVRPPARGRRRGRGTAIMKLTTMTQVTIDGVMQGNGGASDEDRRNGFERGGWARGAGDDETRTFITQTYQRAEAFLFGRRTYELFADVWGPMRAHPIGAALNEAPK